MLLHQPRAPPLPHPDCRRAPPLLPFLPPSPVAARRRTIPVPAAPPGSSAPGRRGSSARRAVWQPNTTRDELRDWTTLLPLAPPASSAAPPPMPVRHTRRCSRCRRPSSTNRSSRGRRRSMRSPAGSSSELQHRAHTEATCMADECRWWLANNPASDKGGDGDGRCGGAPLADSPSVVKKKGGRRDKDKRRRYASHFTSG
jgi:hypothetical protein